MVSCQTCVRPKLDTLTPDTYHSVTHERSNVRRLPGVDKALVRRAVDAVGSVDGLDHYVLVGRKALAVGGGQCADRAGNEDPLAFVRHLSSAAGDRLGLARSGLAGAVTKSVRRFAAGLSSTATPLPTAWGDALDLFSPLLLDPLKP